MIHDASTFGRDVTVDTDVCIVGTGAGGAMVARVAAEAGLRVVALEAGAFLTPEHMTQREEEMLPRLLWESGSRTTSDRGVRVHQGKGVGGSTLHNLNLCARAPEPILREWRETRGLDMLTPERWDDLYTRVEAMLEVGDVPRDQWNRHNRIVERGLRELGWRHGGMRHNRTGCVGSGFCEIGCAYDAKNNAAKVLVPPAVRNGATVITNAHAARIVTRDGRARGVEAVARHPVTGRPSTSVHVRAEHIVVAASATGTPALLLRSGIAGPDGSTGDTLRVHPALVTAGIFTERVAAWEGIPQAVECREFLDFEAVHPGDGGAPTAQTGTRTWIVPAFAHPMATSTMMPGIGASHLALMEDYASMAVVTNMIHDLSVGRVRPRGPLGLRIDYWPNAADRRELAFGLARSAELLFAAGAERVVVPSFPATELDGPGAARELEEVRFAPGWADITAVHPMATVPMGADPAQAAVDGRGRHHHVEGLWVADGSLFPTSIGGPPQLTIYALGLHVGEAIVEAAGR